MVCSQSVVSLSPLTWDQHYYSDPLGTENEIRNSTSIAPVCQNLQGYV